VLSKELSDQTRSGRNDEPFNAWELATQRGNRAFDASDFQAAGAEYDRANRFARSVFIVMLQSSEIHPTATPMVVISAGNAARNYEAQGKVDDARSILTGAVNLLSEQLLECSVCRCVKGHILQHLPRLIADASGFLDGKSQACEHLDAAIQGARTAALSSLPAQAKPTYH